MLAGYFAASLVAAILIPVALTFVATFGDGPVAVPSNERRIEWWSTFRAATAIMLIYASVFAVLAAPVALPAILFAEYRSIQSPVYYGWIGLRAGGLASGLHIINSGVHPSSVVIFLFFGLLGVLPALSYWLIAGRKAGE